MPQTIHPPARTGRRRAAMVAAAVVVTGSLSVAFAQRKPARQFTPDDVHAIVTSLRSARDQSIYLIRTPVFKDGKVAGTQVHGTLPMKQVQLLAQSLNIKLDKNANVIAVFDPDDGDDSGGGGGGGGGDVNEPGSMFPANGRDLSDRIDLLLGDIDVSSFQFLR